MDCIISLCLFAFVRLSLSFAHRTPKILNSLTANMVAVHHLTGALFLFHGQVHHAKSGERLYVHHPLPLYPHIFVRVVRDVAIRATWISCLTDTPFVPECGPRRHERCPIKRPRARKSGLTPAREQPVEVSTAVRPACWMRLRRYHTLRARGHKIWRESCVRGPWRGLDIIRFHWEQFMNDDRLGMV